MTNTSKYVQKKVVGSDLFTVTEIRFLARNLDIRANQMKYFLELLLVEYKKELSEYYLKLISEVLRGLSINRKERKLLHFKELLSIVTNPSKYCHTFLWYIGLEYQLATR